MDNNQLSYKNMLVHLTVLLPLLIMLFMFPMYMCDDAYITMKCASNMSQGHGLVFNIGEPIYVTTNPGWGVALSLSEMLIDNQIVFVKAISLLCIIALLFIIINISKSVFDSYAPGLIAVVLLCLNPIYIMTNFAGMETSLYVLLVYVTLCFCITNSYIAAMIVASLAVWIRIDAIILYSIVVIMFLWTKRVKRKLSGNQIISNIAPSFIIIISYLIFGLLCYGNIIPYSARFKASSSPYLFSMERVTGILQAIYCFYSVFLGKLEFWFTQTTYHNLFIIPLLIGIIVMYKQYRHVFIPIAIYVIIYIMAVTSSGNPEIQVFPWYFTPVLPGLYFVTGFGLSWMINKCCSLFKGRFYNYRNCFRLALLVLIIASWSLIMLDPLYKDAATLKFHFSEREKAYAAATIWINKYVGSNSEVAASEIGTIGYYSRSDVHIVDLYGLLRKSEEAPLSPVELLLKHRPSAIIINLRFRSNSLDDIKINRDYEWIEFKLLSIGLRSDFAPEMKTHLVELKDIYDHLDNNEM